MMGGKRREVVWVNPIDGVPHYLSGPGKDLATEMNYVTGML